jgi:threonine dehydratase
MATEVVTLDDVLRARERIGDRLVRTPLVDSPQLSELTGSRVLLKAELFQRTGSFKTRGVLSKLATLTDEERSRGVISISAGNHAQAVAFGAAAAGIDALLVMWRGANQFKIDATRSYGATVDLETSNPTEALERLRELQEETGRVLVHPFEDPLVVAGAGTVGLELVEDVQPVDVVVVGTGGGGLVTGVAAAVKGSQPHARVVAVEPEGSPALREGLSAGEPVPVPTDSIADGVCPPHAGQVCIDTCASLGVESVLVSDAEIEDAFRFLYANAKLACEPAGAGATAALLAGRIEVEPGETIVVIVSGGNAEPQKAAAILGKR